MPFPDKVRLVAALAVLLVLAAEPAFLTAFLAGFRMTLPLGAINRAIHVDVAIRYCARRRDQ